MEMSANDYRMAHLEFAANRYMTSLDQVLVDPETARALLRTMFQIFMSQDPTEAELTLLAEFVHGSPNAISKPRLLANATQGERVNDSQSI